MQKVVAILASRMVYGKERSNIEVYQLLAKSKKYELTVLVSNKAESRMYSLLEGVNYIKMDFPDRTDKNSSFVRHLINLPIINCKIWKMLASIKPDILFVNNEVTIYDLFVSLIRYKGKIVYRIGDEPAYPHLRFKKANSFMWRKFCLEKVDVFVYISDYIKKSVIATGRNAKKDKIIYNFPPARPIIADKPKRNLLTLSSGERIIFGYIGQITAHKGVDIFIQNAIRLLREGASCEFLVGGSLSYDTEFGDIIKKMVADCDHIHLLGEIDDIELFYNTIDVLCVPSIKPEPLGNVIVEAKMFHCPCVIFPSGGMPELISHKQDGYICTESTVGALYEGMSFYLNNPSIIDVHKKASYDSIYKLGIDRANYEKNWFNVFDSLLSENKK